MRSRPARGAMKKARISKRNGKLWIGRALEGEVAVNTIKVDARGARS